MKTSTGVPERKKHFESFVLNKAFLSNLHLLCSVCVLIFIVLVVLCIFIFVCTSVGLLPPGESPIAVSK
jgi:hypothetical protein